MAGAGYKLFNTGDVLTAAQVNTYLNEQTVMVFASSAARTSALSGVLAEGMVSYLQDTNAVEVYNGSAWVGVSGAGDVTEVQAGTGISVASGTGPIPVVTNTMATTIDAKGDLIVGTGADTFARLAVGGTNGHTLQVDSSTATGLKWAASAGGGGKVLQVVSGTLTASTSTNSTSYSDTGLSATITPSAATSKILIYLNAPGAAAYAGTNQTDVRGLFRLVRTSTTINAGTVGIYNQASASSQNHTPPYFAYLDSPSTTSATTYKITYRSISANVDFYFQGLVTDAVASLILMEIGA